MTSDLKKTILPNIPPQHRFLSYLKDQDTKYKHAICFHISDSLVFSGIQMQTVQSKSEYWDNIHILNCVYWKYSPQVVISKPRDEVERFRYDHKRWIFPIYTIQNVYIDIIYNFIPLIIVKRYENWKIKLWRLYIFS